MNAAAGLPGPLSRTRERLRVRARDLRQTSPEAERTIWQRLRWKFRRQHPVGAFFADFACVEARLIIELDGGQHFEPDAEVAEKRRPATLETLGFSVLRFDNHQALAETDTVWTAILQWLDARHPHPHPLPPAGEGVHSRTTP